MGLYQKHRPNKLKDVIGQPSAVKMVEGLFSGSSSTFPKALLLHGPSGSGKTTLARIMAKMLGCNPADFIERNIADFRGIDSVREIRQALNLRPIGGGKVRIWLLDEAHTQTPDAQEALLKLLEDAPGHVHFFLCTTNPSKLKPTIRTRCTDIGLKPVKVDLLADLCKRISEAEGHASFSMDVCDRIAEASDGSPRKALVILESVLWLDSEEEMLDAISRSDQKAEAINLAQALIKPNVSWGDVAKILRQVEDDAESLRRMVLGYCQSIMLSEKPNPALQARCAVIIGFFQYPLYDSLKPGLVKMCWDVVHLKK